MSSPARSRPDGFDLAVVALSARALARSARRAGLRVLAVDLFADADTREHATLSVRAQPSRRGPGFDRTALLAPLEAHAPEGLPVVLGAGFEHAPQLMRAIARRNPIRGATPEQVALLKDPFELAGLLARLDIPHPPIRPALYLSPLGRGRREAPGEGEPDFQNGEPPHQPGFAGQPLPTGERWAAASSDGISEMDGDWLSKRAGASGGAHIREGAEPGRGRYLQRRVDGRAVSALFLANGERAKIIGLSEQWPDPTPRAPYRYGGAVGPIALPADLAMKIAAALDRLAAATSLRGVASADMIVSDDAFCLIEINPRPGATLDLFDRSETPSLLALHLDACAGALPASLPQPGPLAAAIVYADRTIPPGARPRPFWTADWPSCDETVPAGAPFCTVFASAPSPAAARRLLAERRTELLASLRASSSVNDNKKTEPA